MAVLYNSVQFSLIILLLCAGANDQKSWAWPMSPIYPHAPGRPGQGDYSCTWADLTWRKKREQEDGSFNLYNVSSIIANLYRH